MNNNTSLYHISLVNDFVYKLVLVALISVLMKDHIILEPTSIFIIITYLLFTIN